MLQLVDALCRECRKKLGENQCERCHGLFCWACTPAHVVQEEHEMERQEMRELEAELVKFHKIVESDDEELESMLSVFDDYDDD